MIRRFAIALGLSAGITGAGAAQQSVTVSAVIVERVDVGPVAVEVRSAGSRMSVRQEEAGAVRGTSLLRSTFIQAGDGPAGALVPVRVREDGILRLERRMMQAEGAADAQLRVGESILIDVTEKLTITRVVAANS